MRFSLLFTLFGLLGLQSYGQECVLTGQVVNNNKVPVKGAYVNVAGFPEINTKTDKLGLFTINLPQEANIVNVEANFYEDYSQRFICFDGDTTNIVIDLGERQNTLADAIIKGDQIDIDKVEKLPAGRLATTTGNFEDQLKFTAIGVSQTNELSSNYNVRGGNYDENLIYVNGIEIYRPLLTRSGQQEGMSFIYSPMVENVNFSAGGFPAYYGDKLSSVLDIQYRDPEDFRGTAQGGIQGGQLHLENSYKDSARRKYTYMIGARYRSFGYLLNSLPTTGDYRPVFADAQGMFTLTPNVRHKISLLGHYSMNKYRVVPQTRETRFGPINDALQLTVFFDGQEISQFNTYTGALNWEYKASEYLTWINTASVFNSKETESFDIQGQYWLDEIETDLGSEDFGETTFNRGVGTFLEHARNRLNVSVMNFKSQFVYNWPGFDREITKFKNESRWGVKYQNEFIDDKIHEWNMLDSAGFSIPQAPADEIQLNNVIITKNTLQSHRYTGFVNHKIARTVRFEKQFDSLTFKSSKSHTLEGGVRAHHWSFNGQTTVSPRLRYVFKPAWYYRKSDSAQTLVRRSAEIRFAAGYYHQPPFYRSARDWFGELNPSIRAQQAIHFVFGTEFTFDMFERVFKFTGEAYYKHLSDIIPYEIDNVRIRYSGENNATGYAAGMDFKLNGEFIKGIESFVSLGFLKTMENIEGDVQPFYINSDGEDIIFGVTENDVVVDTAMREVGYIPRPSDQRVSVAIFFQDEMPRWPEYKVQLSFVFGTALPFGLPDQIRYNDINRTPPYRRADIGFSRDLFVDKDKYKGRKVLKHIEDAYISLEVFNLLGIQNTVSYTWVNDIYNRLFAVPNQLTGRRLNLKFVVSF